MKRECQACGEALVGMGAHNAVLCLNCWAEVIAEVEQGAVGRRVAEQWGIKVNTLYQKMFVYSDRRGEPTE